ncbi:DUF3319 domain-containing protein [Vibrio maerlii]|uniref:DUF3319 domain-containing protein n=1 Tax=Vibrio maerlii TaxID=2231648 RepID=UPI000E3E4096|nr:DUF3319 domain-containing protein [Vibrio maerlii]
MAITNYRGFNLKGAGSSQDLWQVKIKNHVLSGNLAAVKKSIDWWVDTAQIIDPKSFSDVKAARPGSGKATSEVFAGQQLKNDTGEPNGWYCMFNGKLLKGSKVAIQKHIEAYMKALAVAKAKQAKR